MVRWSVCLALTPLARTDDTALRYLVELSTDPDPMVRDWSCASLYQTGRDTPEVRHALVARIHDDDTVTRAEALRALAAIGEPAAAEPLLAAIDAVGTLDTPVHASHDRTDDIDEAISILTEALSLLADRTADPHLLARVEQHPEHSAE
jgi:HEAT repeat protein